MSRHLGGWARLWIVVSSCYVLLVLGLAVWLYEAPAANAHATRTEAWSTLDASDRQVLSVYRGLGYDTEVELENPSMSIFVRDGLSVDEAGPAIRRFLNQLPTAQKTLEIRNVLWTVAFMVTPPLLLASAGLAVGWVISGFRGAPGVHEDK